MNLNFEPVKESEIPYLYPNQIRQSYAGCVGVFTANLGFTNASLKDPSWHSFLSVLQTDEFTKEFEAILLQISGGMMKDEASLEEFLLSHSTSPDLNTLNGYKVNTEKYVYMLNFEPSGPLTIYCYSKRFFEEHLAKTEKGIRIIDPHYNTTFTVKDDGYIRIKAANGHFAKAKVVAIDEYHVALDNLPMHLCEFAEYAEKNGFEVTPWTEEGESGYLKVLALHPGKEPFIKYIPDSLQAMQKEVSGYIEAFHPFKDPVAIICNENGKLRKLPLNRMIIWRNKEGSLSHLQDLVGNCFLAGIDGDEFVSLTDEQIAKYKEICKTQIITL